MVGWRPRTALGITHASAALFFTEIITWDRASIEALALVDFCFAFSVFVLFLFKAAASLSFCGCFADGDGCNAQGGLFVRACLSAGLQHLMKGARSDCLLACFEHLVSQTQDGVPGLDQLQVAKHSKASRFQNNPKQLEALAGSRNSNTGTTN